MGQEALRVQSLLGLRRLTAAVSLAFSHSFTHSHCSHTIPISDIAQHLSLASRTSEVSYRVDGMRERYSQYLLPVWRRGRGAEEKRGANKANGNMPAILLHSIIMSCIGMAHSADRTIPRTPLRRRPMN
ncbi:hypothetical protein BKA64DRAFT_271807 [Cadophora sp. MPI-SDFR-AT-0126]|nr:hypothetical protein BKA64DRAFT_271807 [Leotiomycetes sp. MPI-SDFR-AT-0126]